MLVSNPRPKRPTRPRLPRKMLRRIELLWDSDEDKSISLSDVLNSLPSDVRAEDVFISVGANEKASAAITYERDVPNLRYSSQMLEYEERLQEYELQYREWQTKEAEWVKHEQERKEKQRLLEQDIKELFSELQAHCG